MQIVTLTTDWGLSDYYIGIVKGRLYSLLNDVLVVDITHNIEDYNLLKTAFIVKNACSQYPEGTIHLIDVNSYEEGEANGSKPKPYVVVKHKNQYYICTDNGLPSMIFGNDEVEITDINLYNETDYYTFAALDLFPKVVKMIAENHSIDYIGNKMKSFYNVSPQKHYITQNNNSILIEFSKIWLTRLISLLASSVSTDIFFSPFLKSTTEISSCLLNLSLIAINCNSRCFVALS